MSEPFVGQVIAVGFNFAPVGWALCQGQLLPISQNEALFSLLGTTYGGDGQSTFALPDLRGRAPLGIGQGPGLQAYPLGQTGGVELVTLTANRLPAIRTPFRRRNGDNPDARFGGRSRHARGGDADLRQRWHGGPTGRRHGRACRGRRRPSREPAAEPDD